jgi:hypothetical protein
MHLLNEVKSPLQRWTMFTVAWNCTISFLWYYSGIFSFQSLHLRRHVYQCSTSGLGWEAMTKLTRLWGSSVWFAIGRVMT